MSNIQAFIERMPLYLSHLCFFFFSSRRRHTRSKRDWSSDVCSSDLHQLQTAQASRRSAEVRLPPAGDTRCVARRLVSSGSPYESTIGYSRAVRDGRHVLVAGTCAVMPDGAAPPADAYVQAKRCLEIIT